MQLPRIQDYRDVNQWAGELVRRLELAQGARVLASRLVAGTNIDLTYDAALQTITFDATGGGGGSGPTDLGYTASTRVLTSSTGADVTLPLFGADPGLTPLSPGGTGTFLRADGAWSAPAAPAPTGIQIQTTRVTRSTNLTANAWTVVGWDQEVFDDASCHDNVTNNSRLTVPAGYSRARLTAYAVWANTSGSARYIDIEKNAGGVQGAGTGIAGSVNQGNNESMHHADSGWVAVTAGDYFEMFVTENAAGTVQLQGLLAAGFAGPSYFQMELIPDDPLTVSDVEIQDEGGLVTASPVSLNFVGGGVTATHLGGGAVDVTVPGTDLAYTAGSRLLASSTGADVTLPLVASGDAGLAPASGGGTANFLRADAAWAVPVGVTNLGYTASTRILTSDTGTDVTLPLVTSANAGLAPASGGGTANFLRADGTWATPPGGGGGGGGGGNNYFPGGWA